MRDSEVVAAIVAGDPDGLAEAYDRYASALYTYCRSLLHEPADAADAVQDTFVIAASRLAGLRDRDRLRPWLYAVARNECHRRQRASALLAATPVDAMPDVTDTSADVSGEAEREELRALMRSAVRGLNDGDADLIELQLRQGLDVAEIAAVLGVSRNHAHALLSRARDQLEISLGALLVARSGREDCAALNTMLQDWDGQLTVLMRKRINRHIERCPVCAERKRRELAPALLLGLAALPIAAMPAGLRAQVLRLASSDTPEAAAHRASVAQRTAPFGRHGFPKPIDPPKSPWWQTRQGQAAAAAVVAAVVAATLVAVALASGGSAHHGARTAALGQGSIPPGASGSASAGSSAGSSDGPSGGPGSPGQPAGPTAPAGGAASPTPASGGIPPPPAGVSPAPTARTSPSATAPSSGRSTSPAAPAPSASSPAAGATFPPARGLLFVTPTTIVLGPAGGTLTLSASYGAVTWSIAESSSLIGVVTVTPTEGTLASGQSTTVTLSVSGPGAGRGADAALDGGGGGQSCGNGQLTVNPGNITVTVDLNTGCDNHPSPSPRDSSSPGQPPPDEARLVN